MYIYIYIYTHYRERESGRVCLFVKYTLFELTSEAGAFEGGASKTAGTGEGRGSERGSERGARKTGARIPGRPGAGGEDGPGTLPAQRDLGPRSPPNALPDGIDPPIRQALVQTGSKSCEKT